MRDRKWRDAVADFSHALFVNPKSGVAHLNLGTAFCMLRVFQDALEHLDHALVLLQENHDNVACGFAWTNRACVHLRMRMMEVHDTHDQTTHDRLQKDLLDAALEDLNRATAYLPTFAPFYVFRGRLLAKQKQHLHPAMVDFATALKMGYTEPL
jgi:tetratricopeptide (TPR) repeat protein